MEMELSTRSTEECELKTNFSKKIKMKPILPKELTEEIPLEEVYVGILKNKQTISKAITSISAILPGFNHLKRCNGTKLLLSRIKESEGKQAIIQMADRNDMEEKNLKQILHEKGFDEFLLEDKFEVMKIPSKAAKTKAQAKVASEIWPLNFHPDMFVENMLTGSLFDDKLLESIEALIKVVVEASEMETVGTKGCGGSSMIVDPQSGKILALAVARVDQHPLWHASMLAVDLVARLQGGGAWPLISKEKSAETNFNASLSVDDATKTTKLRKRKYEEGDDPLFYPETLSKLKLPEPIELELCKKKCKKSKNSDNLKGSCSIDSVPSKVGPYLCTGYWAFLYQEPCALCAMALLHSRISKIFYCVENEYAGVLGSKAILHALPGLNHRYQVWSAALQN